MTREKLGSLSAMAFYNEKGLVAAYKQARKFAGKGGRIATMPDIVTARLASKPEDTPWEKYFTTMSAEYLGYSRGGVRILIVAHGIGPMSSLDGILQAYSFEFKDKTRAHNGGRISVEEFRKLEDGEYGDVSIVELDPLLRADKYFFYGQMHLYQALQNPLIKARLGPDWERYLLLHGVYARQYHREQGHGDVQDPYIVHCGDASNCGYGSYDPRTGVLESYRLDQDGLPLAHLLSTGALFTVSHEHSRVPSLCNDVGAHEWWNGVRLLAIQAGGTMDSVHPGIDVDSAVRRHWKELMREVSQSATGDGFYALTEIDAGTLFTQYPKAGARMDTHEPEFLVTSAERVHKGPKTFSTTIGGYHGFFKYGIKEVQAIAPRGANAYYLPGEVGIVWKDGNPVRHVTHIQFYSVKVDTTKRLIRASELRENFELMMRLIELEELEQTT